MADIQQGIEAARAWAAHQPWAAAAIAAGVAIVVLALLLLAVFARKQPERHVLVVYTNAAPGREDEFNDWYDNEHLPDVLKIPGYVAAKRYVLSPEKLDAEKPDFEYRYLAIYEIEGCSAREALDRLAEARKTMHISDAMEKQRINMTFTPL